MQSREERIARNDSTFRDANEKIATAAGRYELGGEGAFHLRVRDRVMHRDSTGSRWPSTRKSGRLQRAFLSSPGHQACEGVVSLLEDHEGYIVLEKEGRAGEVATELDPRSDS